MQRTVKTVVTAAIGDYVSKMGAAASATVGFATKSAQAMKAADRTVKGQAASIAAVSAKASAEWGKVSSALVVGGAAGLAASALAVKAAVSWESAWAGVTKTVDGSVSEMATLEGSLRSMARSLPASHQEIASVAEAAGASMGLPPFSGRNGTRRTWHLARLFVVLCERWMGQGQ